MSPNDYDTYPGRPAKDPEERKSEYIRIRCTPYQKLDIQSRAESLGMSVSEYGRLRLLEQPVMRLDRMKSIDRMITNFNRMGSKLDDIAATLTSAVERGDDPEAVRLQKHHKKQLIKIYNTVIKAVQTLDSYGTKS